MSSISSDERFNACVLLSEDEVSRGTAELTTLSPDAATVPSDGAALTASDGDLSPCLWLL